MISSMLIHSYDRSYQFILDDMIRGDLALIGSVNGTELLIFPSNQLPERSNRKKTPFFILSTYPCAYNIYVCLTFVVLYL